jgi:hypothetical protein
VTEWLPQTLLITQLASTLPLVGLIWIIQCVHYPLFYKVGDKTFIAYQLEHMNRIGPLVGTLMLAEVLSTVGLVMMTPNDPWALAGLGLVILIWGSTAVVQIPYHRTLTKGFDEKAHRRLVGSNWIRTVAWTARGAIALVMAQAA